MEYRIHGNEDFLPNTPLGGVQGLKADEDLRSRYEMKSSFFSPFFNK
jgi:hypothetical protein